jgi:hypothetical protein
MVASESNISTSSCVDLYGSIYEVYIILQMVIFNTREVSVMYLASIWCRSRDFWSGPRHVWPVVLFMAGSPRFLSMVGQGGRGRAYTRAVPPSTMFPHHFPPYLVAVLAADN